MSTQQDLKYVVAEEELGRRLLCSWMPSKIPHPNYIPSVETMRWALNEKLNQSISTLAELRAKYVLQWHSIWGDKPREGTEYWDGISHSSGLADRIRTFILRYDVVYPLSSYTLKVTSDITVSGEAAVIQHVGYRGYTKAFVLDIIDYKPKFYLMPNIVALARWLAMRETYDGVGLGLMHFPLRIGMAWHEDDVNEKIARSWVNMAVREAITNSDYPRPGSHCRDCSTPCKEVFRGPDGNSQL